MQEEDVGGQEGDPQRHFQGDIGPPRQGPEPHEAQTSHGRRCGQKRIPRQAAQEAGQVNAAADHVQTAGQVRIFPG